MGDLEAKLVRKITLNGKDADVFLAFNLEEYGEKEFSKDVDDMIDVYANRKKPMCLKKSRNLMKAIRADKNIFSAKPSFADFESKVEKIFAELFLRMLNGVSLPLSPDRITLEVSKAIEDGVENVATIDEKNSTKEHLILKFHGNELAYRFFPIFYLINGASLSYITKSLRHEIPHFTDLFTINKKEREGLKSLKELNAPYSAQRLYYFLFEFLKESRATMYEFMDYYKFTFNKNKGENFRSSIIKVCRENDAGRINRIYDDELDKVDVIYRQSFLAAYAFCLSYNGSLNKRISEADDKLIIACLPHDIREQFMKDTALMRPVKFIESSAKAFNGHGLELYCPLTPQFVQYALEETLKGMERAQKEKIKEIFSNQAL